MLLCNGLGTNPYAWPALLRGDCGVRVLSWNHRGVGGSQRPVDEDRVGVAAFVEDALAVLDDNTDIAPAAARLPQATLGMLPGSHFLQMERPQEVHEELLALVGRATRPTEDDRRRA